MKRRIVSAFVAGLLGASFFAPAVAQPGAQSSGGGVSAKPAPTLDTYVDWTGGSVADFGRPDSSTYGQVISVVGDETELVRFRFYMHKWDQSQGAGHLVLRGEVYAWNGKMATGPALWEGVPRRLTLDPAADGYRRVGFRVGGVELTAGAKYVLFASISKDYEESTRGYFFQWASVPGDSYRSGTFVYLNDTGDESQWTTKDWTTDYAGGIDLAFKAWFRPPV